jgi:hypothetical protein
MILDDIVKAKKKEVEINPAHVIQEGNYNNNVGTAEVTIP